MGLTLAGGAQGPSSVVAPPGAALAPEVMAGTTTLLAERPAAEYSQARFTGYGGTDIHLVPAPAPPVETNQVIARLRDDVERLSRTYRDFFDTHADMDPRAMTRTKEGWAVTWRRWALDDLTDEVAEQRNVYVIHRGDSFQHRLFLDKAGRHLLAIQPQDPFSAMRYRKLRPDQDLCDLYGPFARLSANPRG
ncbi:hypothetical protein BKE38_26110 [Pseudoroseomonas deserti]|uniref:Uncharacterized protein n=2 Tax=Teichococcus deserti TaxID=1817963 RepID=A0A1V2GUW4_9PROT|nr:hypothetical protein BKE38_26110 [Pseudoroseomonas deserti]